VNRYLTIDPLALLLRNDIYVRLHLPDPPPDEILRETIREAARQMNAEERLRARAAAVSLGRLASAMQEELNSLG
jgi:hypothetical protein